MSRETGRLLPWRSVILGAAAGVANIAVARGLARPRRVELAALELAFIAGAYPGLALGKGAPRTTALELVAAGPFFGLALVGLSRRSRGFVAAGLVLHGGWDVLHHRREFGVPAPHGYPGFCLVADLALLAPLARAQEKEPPLPERQTLQAEEGRSGLDKAL